MCFCGCRSCGMQAARARDGILFWRGVLRFKKTLSYEHQTLYMGAPWQGLLGAAWLNELGCSVHVQCTCKCFAPIDFFPPFQAKRWASLMRTLQVTCILSRQVCFCGYRSCGVQPARTSTAKLYSRGILRLQEILSYRHEIWYANGVPWA